MLVLAFSVLGVLALGPLAVLSDSFSFNLSAVEQCGPVTISFFGKASASDTVPTTLTLLPFDSEPIFIPISNSASNTTGVALTFLPLAAETRFIASFDDAAGNTILRVTDVIRVLPSPTNDSTCLPPANEPRRHFFALNSSISQCQPFKVSYDTKVIAQPPSVRLFSPRGVSVGLNQTVQPVNGTATYRMCAERGKQVVLMFDDGHTRRETTSLITVGGDSASDKSCICSKVRTATSDQNSNSTSPPPSGSGSPLKLSRAAIIGIGAGGAGFVSVLAVIMVLYVVRERRRRRARGITLGDDMSGKGIRDEGSGSSTSSHFPKYSETSWDPKSRALSPTPPDPPPKSPTYLNPPYTAKNFFSISTLDYPSPKDTIPSFSAFGNDQVDQTLQHSEEGPKATGRDGNGSHPSISSTDIKTMLDVATMHLSPKDGPSRMPMPIVPVRRDPTEDFTLPSTTTIPQPYPVKGHLRDTSHSVSLSESLTDRSSVISPYRPFPPLRVTSRGRARNGADPAQLNITERSGWL